MISGKMLTADEEYSQLLQFKGFINPPNGLSTSDGRAQKKNNMRNKCLGNGRILKGEFTEIVDTLWFDY